ncbi:hypothetical protein [Piscinibacter sp. HJYY11]|uniref:hypothetical protein n=1 Tax=Piscinibacter sp. HJYY11 TaxID=2801333 RepID=UPI001920080A|nr:hypothetical protein [Piscinibacter sp. HJYY11]MBL0727782.1 hypothetical protein [Piscinibacter sp. HJYY11]
MHKAFAFLAATLMLAGTVSSATLELGMELMQTIEDLNKSLSSNIALRDARATLADAKELDGLFTQVEAHFIARGDAANAVELSKKSRTLTQAIIQSAGSSDFEAATNAATDLSRTCRTCHTFYKKE